MNRIKWWIRHCFKIKDCKHCCLWCQYYKSCSTDWAEPVKKEKTHYDLPHYDFDTSRVKTGIITVDKLEAKVLSYDPKILLINDHLSKTLAMAKMPHEAPSVATCDYYDSELKTCRRSKVPSAWIDNHNGTYTCDRCGCKHSQSNFCPNCGADMRGLATGK